jgi:hypothetical protein
MSVSLVRCTRWDPNHILDAYEQFIAPYLQWHHPLKGAIFARDWIAEARETTDETWQRECVVEARRAVLFLKEAL